MTTSSDARGRMAADARTNTMRRAALLVSLTAPLLGLAVFAVLRWVEWGEAPAPRARGGTAELAVWQFLVTASVIVWAVLAGLGLRLVAELRANASSERPIPGARRRVAVFVLYVCLSVAIVLVAGGAAGLRNPFVMAGQDWKVPALHVVAGFAMVPLLVALSRTQLLAAADPQWSALAGDVQRIRVLRRVARAATAALGIVIALAVVATGALREATAAAHLTPIPDTFVLVYGAWFTAVVAAIYLHVHGAIEARGRWLQDAIAPLTDESIASAEGLAATRARRNELAQELELGGDAKRDLEGLLSITAPLVGALITQFVGT